MKIELAVQSKEHTELIPVTQEVQRVVSHQNWKQGVLTLFVPHTTSGIIIQEQADPDVARDIIYALDKIVPWRDPKYHHAEGNTASHVKAAMLGTSAQCSVENGKLVLGTWQGIFFCEFDGPRNRQLWLTFTRQEIASSGNR